MGAGGPLAHVMYTPFALVVWQGCPQPCCSAVSIRVTLLKVGVHQKERSQERVKPVPQGPSSCPCAHSRLRHVVAKLVLAVAVLQTVQKRAKAHVVLRIR